MEKEYKNKLNNKETQIIQLQTKIDLLTGSKKAISPPDIKKVFISNSSKGKQNINYNNYDFYNNKYIKKDKNQTLDYISQFAKNKTINILNSNISIKTIKNYHPDNANMNNNINENNNQIMLYKYPINNHKYDNTKKDKLDKNNSAPNIHLYNLDINSNNVRKKFFLNNNKINKYKKPNINLKEQKIILKENEDKNIIEMKERTINSKNNYKKIKLPFYIVNNNKNFEEKLKMNLNTNNINDNLINKIKQKNIDEYNKYINLKLDEMENFNKLKANRKKKIKSCESRKSISPKKKLQKKFNKIMSSTTIEKDLYRNNSAFNIIFKNINNEKGEKYSQLKNMILNNNKNEFNNNILNNQRDKSHINNSRKINLNNNNGKIYLESYSKVLNKNII